MRVIIDLIEDVREQIGSHETYEIMAGLLKTDVEDSEKLVYAGEAPLNTVELEREKRQLTFKIDGSDQKLTIGELIPSILILDMEAMLFELKMDVNAQYKDMEIVGFGKNDEQKRYILFIKI
jgi:hypothetical protein